MPRAFDPSSYLFNPKDLMATLILEYYNIKIKDIKNIKEIEYVHQEIEDEVQKSLLQLQALSKRNIGLFKPDGQEARPRR